MLELANYLSSSQLASLIYDTVGANKLIGKLCIFGCYDNWLSAKSNITR